MYDYISGKIAELSPTNAVIDAGGVGYDVNITLQDYEALHNQGAREAKFYVHEAIREDAHVLWGFLTKEGREVFRLLIGVSGVGPNTGRLILSSVSLDNLKNGIASGNVAMLKNVKGIGAKTAQRIIVDLKDKINLADVALITSMPTESSQAMEDAMAALQVLGYTPQQTGKALRKLFADNPSLATEEAIRLALKMI